MSDCFDVSSRPLDTDPGQWLNPVVQLAREAGRLIMEIYNTGFDVDLKADQSPLTNADVASHRHILGGLQLLTPHYPVLSEESASIAFEDRVDWETFWLVDPLYGTKEFIKRNGEFTVNIALIHQNRVALGVVYAPALNLSYFACENCGAFRQADGEQQPVPISVTQMAQTPLRVVGSRSHGTPDMERYLSRLGDHQRLPVGSSLKFCLVAEGRADLYPRIGPTSEWDTAASQCIVEQAGGAVVDLHGHPLRYNTKSSILNPFFLVYGDRSRDWTHYAAGITG